MQRNSAPPHRCGSAVPVRRIAALLLALLVPGVPGRAHAAKWHSCPGNPDPVYPSAIGALNAPFAHPGHDLRISLNEGQVGASGGFALTPDGNRLEITIQSAYGAPVVLAPRFAAGTSASSLTFAFPDTAVEVGRSLAGPAEVRVLRGDTLVARIDASDLVALPPRTDVTALLMGLDPQQVVQAALGADGDVWIPASFHGKEMPMPGCPGDVMMPMQIEVAAAEIEGAAGGRRGPLERMRRMSLYFGDFEMNGFSFYGAQSPDRIALRHVAGSRGISLCQMNDVIDMVLRVRGNRSWARSKRSPFASVVRDASPISLRLRGSRPMPETARATPLTDSVGSSCETAPDVNPAGKPDDLSATSPSGSAPPAPSPRR